MADQYFLVAGRGLDRQTGIAVIAAYLMFVPCAYTLPDLMGATRTRDLGKACTAASRRPEDRFQQFGYCRRAWDDDIERLQRAAWRSRRPRRMRNLELAS